jgi:hypothetical protein
VAAVAAAVADLTPQAQWESTQTQPQRDHQAHWERTEQDIPETVVRVVPAVEVQMAEQVVPVQRPTTGVLVDVQDLTTRQAARQTQDQVLHLEALVCSTTLRELQWEAQRANQVATVKRYCCSTSKSMPNTKFQGYGRTYQT